MNTKLHKRGQLLLSLGLIIWSLSSMAKTSNLGNSDSFFNSKLFNILFYSGILVELIGFIILAKTGGFKNKRFCKFRKS